MDKNKDDERRKKINEQQRKWRAKNPEKVKEYQHRSYLKRKDTMREALKNLRYWQNKVAELERQLEMEAKGNESGCIGRKLDQRPRNPHDE